MAMKLAACAKRRTKNNVLNRRLPIKTYLESVGVQTNIIKSPGTPDGIVYPLLLKCKLVALPSTASVLSSTLTFEAPYPGFLGQYIFIYARIEPVLYFRGVSYATTKLRDGLYYYDLSPVIAPVTPNSSQANLFNEIGSLCASMTCLEGELTISHADEMLVFGYLLYCCAKYIGRLPKYSN
jgi:hypothetical protein